LNDITKRMSGIMQNLKGYTIVFDKGNNSQKNIEDISDLELIRSFVGSLCFTSYKSFANIPLKQFNKEYDKWNYVELKKEVFDQEAKIVICYSDVERQHQLDSFNKKIKETQQKLQKEIDSIKKKSDKNIKSKIEKYLYKNKIKSSKAKRYVNYSIDTMNDKYQVTLVKTNEAIKKQKTFGKRILFTYDLEMPAEKIVQLYHDKYKVEDAFRSFKRGEIVNYTPIFHWTDSKIRVQSFVNIMAYLLIKITDMKIRNYGDRLSLASTMEILEDIKEVTMIFSTKKTMSKVSYPSKYHEKIARILDLEKYES